MISGPKLLKFARFPDGSRQALVSYEKTITINRDFAAGPLPANENIQAHELRFFQSILEQIQEEQKTNTADVSDVECKELTAILEMLKHRPAPAPGPARKPGK